MVNNIIYKLYIGIVNLLPLFTYFFCVNAIFFFYLSMLEIVQFIQKVCTENK